MLTKKQKELFEYLSQYIEKNSISPSFEEMKSAVNLKSKSGIHRLITSLEQRGFIKRLKHKARAMEITRSLKNNINIYEKNSENNSVSLPLLGMIAAGNPIEAIENPDEFISVPSNLVSANNQYFGLKVNGLSMIEKGIFDGDIAIIKKTNTSLNGKIAAVLTSDNEITLKTVYLKNNKIHLIPANKNYKEKVLNINEVQIQGTLSGIIRKYN
ncbi:MAG: LexA repressor [Alphaproteobacteria bacterium MarineAlpha5_Bin8]|nr:MAG: LexA repressor [Alphaproteobacteria bacterium MarineAlpha5_Bin7]PPR46573.1 MAG: LexA repressor [Alphaproteobacteria bacterium MarineAlpha5_Bin8]PPR53281.1 MAG: LexA repressor [Alphaproteobacteria bacterium MarineAlpha5_Bin6]|tara:strand:- start:608 stop:1246 length:639 start_codon:yes stop_codon:yes gene_type:complete